MALKESEKVGTAPFDKLKERLPSQGLDALIVLDAGYEVRRVKEEDGSLTSFYRPTLETKMCLWAAAQLFSSEEVKRIFLCGGKLLGEELPADSQVMKEFLLGPVIENRFGIRIPEAVITTEEESRDTSENFRFVKIILESHPEIQTVGVISHRHHLLAGGKLAANSLKRKTEFFNVDEVLRARSPHYNRLIKNYYSSWVKKPKSREFRHAMFTTIENFFRLGILIFDREGQILSWLADRGITASTLYEQSIRKVAKR